MSDRLEQAARMAAQDELKRMRPRNWAKDILNALIAVLVIGFVICAGAFAIGAAASTLYHLFLAGWEVW